LTTLSTGNEMDSPSTTKIRFTPLFYAVLVLGLAGCAYTFLRRNYLVDSAALYIGLPLLLAVGMSLLPETKSAFGATMKGITIALLLSAIVLQEGTICILFASPIFYGVGAIVATLVDRVRQKAKTQKYLSVAFIAVLALLSGEGTLHQTSFNRDNSVTVSKIVSATRDEVRAQLMAGTTLGADKPLFLSLFPYPVSVAPLGLEIGDEARIHFVYMKHIWWTKVEGDLVLRVTDSTQDKIVFKVMSDDSYLSHYLKWHDSEVSLATIDNHHTQVTWRLTYTRILDPIWYFSPMQNYAVRLAAEELIDHVATPRG
jgi:hypothetical protein